MMKIKFLLLTALLLTACATPYQRFGTDETGGYLNKRISVDTFSVTFSANGATPPKRAADFAMLRAAETTMEYNYSYFSIVGEEDQSSSHTVQIQQPSYTYGTATTYGNTTTFQATTTHSTMNMPVYLPKIVLAIKCYTKPPGGHSGKIYHASSVAAELRAKYNLKPGQH